MKRNIVWTMFFGTMLLLNLAAAAMDKNGCTCSNNDIAGEWGTVMTGTIILPTGAVPFAAVNKATYDFAGNYWGTQTRSNNGTVSRVTFRGTYIVNSDCTGSKTTRSYDQSEKLLNTVTQDFVLVNSANELFETFTSNTLPNGTTIPSVVTGHSKRLFPDGEFCKYQIYK
jgi:hypothetical protein